MKITKQLTILLFVGIASHAAATDDNSFTMSLVTRDLEVTRDSVAFCQAFEVPANASYIVEFSPHPLLDVLHHFNVYLCKHPGIGSTVPYDQLSWNCFGEDFAYQPGLPNGTICESDELPAFASFDNNKKNIGLKLPDGYGFKVGGDSGYNFVVMATHYPLVKGLRNGRTGHSEMKLRLIPEDPQKRTKRVGLFNLSAWAMIPPRSVTSMNGSYVFDQSIPMTPIALLTHTHGHATDFEVLRTTVDGSRELMWKQDPSRETHFLVPPHLLSTISDGDTLTLRCTFNNTSPATLEIRITEMCNLLMIFAVDGADLVADPTIYTVHRSDADLFPKETPGYRLVYH